MKNNVLISLSIVALLMIGSVNRASAQRNKNREKTEFVQKDGAQENTVSQSAKQNAANDIESLYNVIEYTTRLNGYIENQDYKGFMKFRKEVIGEEFIKNNIEQMEIYRKQQ